MYTWIEHTAELELELRASDEGGVFGDAVAAFAELLGEESGEPVAREVVLRATDPASQLVELLEELVFLADTEGFVPRRLMQIDLVQRRAVVEGNRGAPPPLIKAVTYHGLEFRRDGEEWTARVVLDV
jgi:SHS2 domain-containing protein